MAEERRCILCSEWSVDSTALTPELREILDKARRSGIIPSDPVLSLYGKCTADYTGQDGMKHYFNFGTLAGSHCRAKDDRGNDLFKR